MILQALSYFSVTTDALDEWAAFGAGLVGMQIADSSRDSLTFRVDERAQRVAVEKSGPYPRVLGWDVADGHALDELTNILDQNGVPNTRMSESLCARRCVGAGLAFSDPDGNRLEASVESAIASESFVPGRSISGFRTGTLGLGHVVLKSTRAAQLAQFYKDVLGARLSDFCRNPFEAYFLHVNPRHHSLAIIQSGSDGMHHMMLEMNSLDDVGQGYDLAQQKQGQVAVTLGRHSNDHMTSFYAQTPSDFMVECGWGGRSINPESWQPDELRAGPSLWGHDRFWLGDEERRRTREMQIAAAGHGNRFPVHVSDDNYDIA